MDSSDSEIEERKTRGATSFKDQVKDPSAVVEFDGKNQAIGKYQTRFANDVGLKTRSTISVTYVSWKKVPKEEKEQLWLNIKDYWNLDDDTRKTQVMKQCNSSWKKFKKELRYYMDEGRNPRIKYTYLPLEDWERFIVMHDNEQVRERRLKGKECARKNLNPARLGPIGYRGHKDQWDKEESTESSSVIHMIKDPRAKHYLLGRRIRDKDGQLRLPSHLENLAEIEKDKQISQGILQAEPGTDALTMVLGPEHPGRTRAVGHTIGLKEGMSHIIGKKRKPRKKPDMSDEIARQMKVVREEIQAEFDHKLEVFKEEMARSKESIPAESPRMRKSSVGSTQNIGDDDGDTIKEPTSCFLLLPDGDAQKRIKCAKGVVHPKGNGEVHSVPLLKGHVKVQVDKVEQKYYDFRLPVPTSALDTLEDAINSFIQWPRRALILSTTSKSMGTKTQLAATSLPAQQEAVSAPIKRNPEKENNLKRMKNRGARILKKHAVIYNPYKRIMSRQDPTEWFDAIIEPRIFGKEGHEFTLVPVDIVDMLAGSWIDITLVIWFARSLHMMLDPRKNNCVVFNPEWIRSSQCLKYEDEVTLYLTQTMQWQTYKRFYLAPYWQGDHRTLFIIIRQTRTGFILDSLKNGKNPYSYHITKYLETAVRTVMKDSNETPIKWMFAECNQQSSGWECGYYVMRWLHEFMLHGQFCFPDQIPWKNTSPFDQKDLDAIVGRWLDTFMPVFFSK